MDKIYFARSKVTGAIKVGISAQLEWRLRDLRTATGGDVELLAEAPGTRRLEGRFHALLFADHIGGEWFNPSPRVEAVALAVREGWFNFAALPDVASPLRRDTALRSWTKRRERQTSSDAQAA